MTPLIEAAELYPAFERLVLGAKRSVWLAFRVFDPDTGTKSQDARDLGLADWTALLRHAVERGVEVRILLTDFEPIMADYLHAGSWSSFQRLRQLLEKLDESHRDRLQLMVIQHEGEAGWLWRQLLRVGLSRRGKRIVDKLLKRKKHADGGFETRPGLWPFLAWQEGRPTGWRGGAIRLWPATYHQKFMVVDGERAVIGGMDLDERRWDDRFHHQRADRTWHDISALVEGPAVGDAASHFALLWNDAIPAYRRLIGEWTDSCGRELMLDPLTEIRTPLQLPAPTSGHAQVQVVRTVSRRSRRLTAMGPEPMIRELKAAHWSIITSARRHLYIEAQFVRSKAAAKWLLKALDRHPELEIIILVANVPEEIAFEGQTENLAHRHGEHLQARALGHLMRKGGRNRVGLFTLAKQERVSSEEEQFRENRGTAFGSGVIHIHSKLLIADDQACLLSSGNINGRSFEWDTELGFIWSEDGPAIGEFRRKLWGQLFGDERNCPQDLEGWRAIARDNAVAAPDKRTGFVVPYQLKRARRFGRPYWFVPDDLV